MDIKNVISHRIGTVSIIGGASLGLSLKNEILDMGLDKGSKVFITLTKDNKILIEKIEDVVK